MMPSHPFLGRHATEMFSGPLPVLFVQSSCRGCCLITTLTPRACSCSSVSLQLQVSSTGAALARVDLFLASSSSSVGCKQLEVPSTSTTQTSFTGSVNIPAQATGALWVYAKCKPTSGTMVMSSYVPMVVQGGTGGNIPPTISLTSPSPTGVYTAPTTLTAAAVACDLDGTLQKVTFFSNGVQYATATAIPFTGSLPVSTAATVTFTAAAVDNTGASVLSAPLTVTVNFGSSSGGGGSTWTLTVQGGTGSGTWPQYT